VSQAFGHVYFGCQSLLDFKAVQTILEFLAAGDSVDEVLEEYSGLTREAVQACLDYASRVMGNHFSVVQTA
jgi:uncharacterized protein (DUF433 family)